jgi:hypothetical protein
MKTAIVFLTILVSVSSLSAQPCFERWYGGSGTDYCFGATRTLDGGYLVYGYTTSYGPATSSVWLIKTGAYGDTLWTRTHGISDVNCATSVLLKLDSGFVVGGYTTSYGAGSYDFYIFKTDPDGYVGVVVPDRPVAQRAAPVATIVSRAQLLAEMAEPGQVLFGAAGRAVEDPSGISPGVYFFGRETARRVVVTR